MEPFTLFAAYLAIRHGRKVVEWVKNEARKSSDTHTAQPFCSAPYNPPSKVVTVAGRSSVGKSSLCNALLGRNAFEAGCEQGTTTKLKRLSLGNGWEIQDTPGLLDKDSYWQITKEAMQCSKAVVYVTTGQLYRREQELLQELHLARPVQTSLLVLLNMQDLKKLTMPSWERDKELKALRAQLPFVPGEHFCCGAASPADGSVPDLHQFKSTLSFVLSRSI